MPFGEVRGFHPRFEVFARAPPRVDEVLRALGRTEQLERFEARCLRDLPRAFREALDIIESGGVTARAFVQAEEPLASLSRVLFRLMEGSGPLKIAIIP